MLALFFVFSLYLFLVWRLRLYSAALLALGCVVYLLRRDIFLREDNRLCYYSWLAVSKECLLSIWYSRKTRKGWSISLDQAWNLKNKPLQWKYFGATKALQFHVIAVSTHHYSDVIMGVMASQITSLTIWISIFQICLKRRTAECFPQMLAPNPIVIILKTKYILITKVNNFMPRKCWKY